MVDYDTAFEIVGKLDCPSGRRIAAYNAESGRQRAVADPTLQQELRVTAALADAGISSLPALRADAVREASAEAEAELRDRLEWRPTRETIASAYNERKAIQYGLGCGANGVRKTSDDVNGSVLGFKDKTTGEFMVENGLKGSALSDYLPTQHASLKSVEEETLRNLGKKCKSREEFEKMSQNITSMYYKLAQESGMHFSEPDGPNPFQGVNRRLKLPGEPVKIKTTLMLPNETIDTNVPTYVPTPFPRDVPNREYVQHSERLALAHIRSLGYTDASQNGDVNAKDMGIDIISARAVGQVKANVRGSPTSFGEIAAFIGSSGDDTPHFGKQRIFYTMKISDPAVAKAENAGVAVYLFNEAGETRAHNSHARCLLENLEQKEEECIATHRAKRRAAALASL